MDRLVGVRGLVQVEFAGQQVDLGPPSPSR